MEHTTLTTLGNALKDLALDKLIKAGCVRGHIEFHRLRVKSFEFGHTAFAPPDEESGLEVLLKGWTGDDEEVIFWDEDTNLNALALQYLNASASETALIEAEFEVSQKSCRFSTRSFAQIKEEFEKAQRASVAKQNHEISQKRNRVRDSTPFGSELAQQVTNALNQGGVLAIHHRDYCGTGLIYSDSTYIYGEVEDGTFVRRLETFQSAREFVDWLSAQSDQSLARLESEHPSDWDNQTITRERLTKFVESMGCSKIK